MCNFFLIHTKCIMVYLNITLQLSKCTFVFKLLEPVQLLFECCTCVVLFLHLYIVIINTGE